MKPPNAPMIKMQAKDKSDTLIALTVGIFSEVKRITDVASRIPSPPKEIGNEETNSIMGIKTNIFKKPMRTSIDSARKIKNSTTHACPKILTRTTVLRAE